MSEPKIVCKQAKNIDGEKKVNGKGQILTRRADHRDAVAKNIGEAPRLHAEESVWRVLRRMKSESQKRHAN